MQIKIYQVDAFTQQLFGGNPAAVCPLGGWPSDELLQAIAEENNLSETAFFVPDGRQFHLRWFTPEAEVDLCGHATLAAAHVLFRHLQYQQAEISFRTRSGELTVSLHEQGLAMDFPASYPEPVNQVPAALFNGLQLSKEQRETVRVHAAYDYVVELASEQEVQALVPDFSVLATLDGRGVVVTAPGRSVDFVSRCFFPKLRVDEDPVTGSAHCELAPFWAQRLQRHELTGQQLSRRGGVVHCQVIAADQEPDNEGVDYTAKGTRVLLIGSVADYLQGMITLPE